MAILDYRDLIKRELAERMGRNRKYSLRAFARDLSISPAPLSRLLHRRQHLSAPSVRLVAHELYKDKSEAECAYFLVLHEYATAPSPAHRKVALHRLKHLAPADAQARLELEALKAIGSWYHVAILELCSLGDFVVNADNISQALKVSKPEIEMALQRLLELGMVKRNPAGNFAKVTRRLLAGNDAPNAVLRELHRQFIEKAVESIEGQSTEERCISSQTLTMSQKDLTLLKQMIHDFFNEVAKKRSARGHDSVYQLNVQLFNLAPGLRSER